MKKHLPIKKKEEVDITADLNARHSFGIAFNNHMEIEFEKKENESLEIDSTKIKNTIRFDKDFDRKDLFLGLDLSTQIGNSTTTYYVSEGDEVIGESITSNKEAGMSLNTEIGYGFSILEEDQRFTLTPSLGLSLENNNEYNLSLNLVHESKNSRTSVKIEDTGEVLFRLNNRYEW